MGTLFLENLDFFDKTLIQFFIAYLFWKIMLYERVYPERILNRKFNFSQRVKCVGRIFKNYKLGDYFLFVESFGFCHCNKKCMGGIRKRNIQRLVVQFMRELFRFAFDFFVGTVLRYLGGFLVRCTVLGDVSSQAGNFC